MLKVHAFLLAAILSTCGACSTSPASAHSGEGSGEKQSPPAHSGGRPSAIPAGFVGDSETMIFHRVDCPRLEGGDPLRQTFTFTPFEALNRGYEPCEYCRPTAGWR